MPRLAASLWAAILLLMLALAAPPTHASITEFGQIKANISHPFIIANTTLPPGAYDFHILQGTDQRLMLASSANGRTSVEFEVRPSVDNHTPRHTELIFNRYGKTEVLKDVYEAGSPNGVAVIEPSREEQRLQKQGQKAYRHTEEQQQ